MWWGPHWSILLPPWLVSLLSPPPKSSRPLPDDRIAGDRPELSEDLPGYRQIPVLILIWEFVSELSLDVVDHRLLIQLALSIELFEHPKRHARRCRSGGHEASSPFLSAGSRDSGIPVSCRRTT